jgi:hypothetical protein
VILSFEIIRFELDFILFCLFSIPFLL